MKRVLPTMIVSLLFWFGAAQAHTHLESSMPADQAVLASLPTEIMLHFSEATRLTALSIKKEGDKQETVVSVLPKQASADISVPVELTGSGKYQVNWRAIGEDNHVMSGKLQFTVQGK